MDKEYSVHFFSCLVEAMQKCCQDCLQFEQAVELSGYLSLEIDNYKKERYVLSEMVHSTGDVISESYCVKAFKTMKHKTLYTKAPRMCEAPRNIPIKAADVQPERMDSVVYPDEIVTHYEDNLVQALQHHGTLTSLKHQTILSSSSGHSRGTSPSEASVKLCLKNSSPTLHPSSAELSSDRIYSGIQAEPGDSGDTQSTFHNSHQSHIQPRTCIQLSGTECGSPPVNVNASCSVLSNSSCNQRKEEVSMSESHKAVQKKTGQSLELRAVKRSAPVIDISVRCKKERRGCDNSILLSTAEESNDLLSYTSSQVHTVELENIQLKVEDEIVCLDDEDKHSNVEQEGFQMDAGVYLNHSTVSETSTTATESRLDHSFSSSEKYLSQNTTLHCYLSKLSGSHRNKISSSSLNHGTFHKCDECNYKTLYTTHLRNHQKIHTREFFPCHLCPRKFADKSQLVYHLKIHAGRLTCTVCQKRFPSLKVMKQHQQLHRDGKA
ncbi:zinc finger protein 485-like [Gigantopelta aegis]|uniref:zinc finger protein 485-like n=1 Tax=Gigantopelta aegis TaxID=1735272 RepID=UPI001B88DD35|nr:zinc finger protein 485-like [Gigantopelta aegis]XP_041370007.1 zinc finger protein 485-like [Gigantopelta aegis]